MRQILPLNCLRGHIARLLTRDRRFIGDLRLFYGYARETSKAIRQSICMCSAVDDYFQCEARRLRNIYAQSQSKQGKYLKTTYFLQGFIQIKMIKRNAYQSKLVLIY